MIVLEEDVLLKTPFNLILAGPSGSGKSEWIVKFLKNYEKMIFPVPQHVLYCYGIFNNNVPVIEKMGFSTYAGIPENFDNYPKPLLLILDDMGDIKKDYLDFLFTAKTHHENIDCIFVVQNCFSANTKVARNNAHYLTLMKSPSYKLQIRTLGSQLFPSQLPYFMDAFKKATEEKFGYLFIDLHPNANENLRLRTNIFPNEENLIFLSK